MGEVLEQAERAWRGDLGGTHVDPRRIQPALEVLDDGAAFLSAFSNALILRTEAGLVFVDTSSLFHADAMYRAVRRWTDAPVHTGIYSHGHVDHVSGLAPFHAEARAEGRPPIRILAHERCPARFARYRRTAGYNGHVNARQFGFPKPLFPTAFHEPDETIGDQRRLEIGGVAIELYHDRGETDDALWAWLPARRAIYAGDFFIWASPNCGNPQKVQRYPLEWAAALRRMAALAPEALFPGHGPPILGAERVARALGETAALLETICEQTLALMNEGATLEDIVHGVRLPEELLARPYLRPIYDDPVFVVRNLWRLYGGWWDGNPAHLKPARGVDLARSLAALAGGARRLAERAEQCCAAGEHALACELAELAWLADRDDPRIRGVRAAVYGARARAETSLMARAIYRAAARESGAGDADAT